MIFAVSKTNLLRHVFRARRWRTLPWLAAALTSAPVVVFAQWPQGLGNGSPHISGAPQSSVVPSIGQILQQAASAAPALNYTGTITYQHRGAVETSRVVHLFENGVEMERITTLDGPPFEVVRVNDEYLLHPRVASHSHRTTYRAAGFPVAPAPSDDNARAALHGEEARNRACRRT